MALPTPSAGREGGAVIGNDHRGTQSEYLSSRRLEQGLVDGARIDVRTLGRPPQMRAHDESMFGMYQRRDVLMSVSRSVEQADRGSALDHVGALSPDIVDVDRPHVVVASIQEQGRVDRVVGVVVRKDDVGHLALTNTQLV